MESISDICATRTVQSVRLNQHLTNICRETGVPLAQIIEACLGHFCTLSDENRVKLLTEYDPDKLDHTRLREAQNIAVLATEKAKQELGSQAGSMPNKALLSIGLVLLGALGIMAITQSNKGDGNDDEKAR